MNLLQLRPIKNRTEDLRRDVSRYLAKEFNKTDRKDLTDILGLLEILSDQIEKMESRKVSRKVKGRKTEC